MTSFSHDLVDHLFRREAGRMVSRLVRILGLRHVELAEDAVQDTLVAALEVWKYGRPPDDASAWLLQSAKNRALDILRRRKTLSRIAPEAARQLRDAESAHPSPDDVRDDQLRLMFSCCHPDVAPEGQIAIILKFLCGFGVSEIAQVFLTSPAAIEKRLTRARNAMKRSEAPLAFPKPDRLETRLDAVLHALYLLFSEGYHGGRADGSVQEDLCYEGMRLTTLLSEHPVTAVPRTHVLLALMCFHAARLPGRLDETGSLVLLEEQDRSTWIRPLIHQGFHQLARSGAGADVTEYHLEAGIAAHHCQAERFEDTDWAAILKLYDLLQSLRPSPIVALNRAIVVGQLRGPDAGLEELGRIPAGKKLKDYPFLPAALGNFHLRAGRRTEAAVHFRRALTLARNDLERRSFHSRLTACGAESV